MQASARQCKAGKHTKQPADQAGPRSPGVGDMIGHQESSASSPYQYFALTAGKRGAPRCFFLSRARLGLACFAVLVLLLLLAVAAEALSKLFGWRGMGERRGAQRQQMPAGITNNKPYKSQPGEYAFIGPGTKKATPRARRVCRPGAARMESQRDAALEPLSEGGRAVAKVYLGRRTTSPAVRYLSISAR
jgi:hypothetical protein